MDAELAPLSPQSVPAAFCAAGRRGRCALPRVRPGCAVPVCAGAQVHALRCIEMGFVATARPAGVLTECHRSGDLPWRGQSGGRRRPAIVRGPRPGRGHRARGCQRHRAAQRSMPLASAACASTSSGAWWMSHRARSLSALRRRVAPLGWHVVIYFEAADLPDLYAFLAVAPRAAGHRSHGPTRRQQTRGRTRIRVVFKAHAGARRPVVQGDLPGAAFGTRSAGLRRRRALRSATGRTVPRPRALGYGLAASQPQGLHAR